MIRLAIIGVTFLLGTLSGYVVTHNYFQPAASYLEADDRITFSYSVTGYVVESTEDTLLIELGAPFETLPLTQAKFVIGQDTKFYEITHVVSNGNVIRTEETEYSTVDKSLTNGDNVYIRFDLSDTNQLVALRVSKLSQLEL